MQGITDPTKNLELVRFPVDSITDNSVTDFDLFVKISDRLVLYGASGYRWLRQELTDLLRFGISDFLIRKSDIRRAEMYKKVSTLPEIDRSLKPSDRIVSIQQLGIEFTKYLYAGEITPACVTKATAICESLIDCLAEDLRCIQAISGLADHDYYTYSHSMRVATYSVVVAIQMGMTDRETLKNLAIGSMMHDIGKKDVPVEVINKTGALNDTEWQAIRKHPEAGHRALAQFLNSEIPKEVIIHHHEKNDGSGYPHGLSKFSLPVEVQVVTLADIFDALTSTRSYQHKRTRFEALDFIRHNMILVGKLSKDPYQALVSCLVAE